MLLALLGLGDASVTLAFILCLASAALCVVYGAMKWNSDGQELSGEEDRSWVEEEKKLEQEL